MARGVVSGMVWGGILGAGGLIAASEALPKVEMLAFAPPQAVEVVQPSTPDAAPQADAQSAVPQAVSVPEVAVPGAPPAPATTTETAMPEATPAPMPAASPTPKAEPAPEVATDVTAPSAEDPVMAQPEAQAPVASASDAAPAIVVSPPPVVAQPAQNAAPEASVAPEVVARAEMKEPVAPRAAAPEVAAVPSDTPMVDAAPSAPAAAMPTETAESAEPADKTSLPQVNTADAGIAPRVSTMPTGVGAGRPSVMTKPEAIGTQAGQIQSAAPVTTGRLPTIGSTTEVAAEAPKNAMPIEMNAVPFDNPDNLPVLSVVLVDDGQFAISDADLAALPFPISIGIPATRADASKAAERYRSAGQEVLVIAALPTGAAPTDAAVTIEAALQSVPQAVAVMDTPGAGFQADRATAAQVVATAGQGGLGLLTYSRGLNAIEQEASREDVRAGVVFRVFDGEGRGVLAMQRYLDQAAFRAAQAPGVILVGTLKKDTLQALAEWRLGSRAATVAMAPVTAALKAE